MKPKFKPGDIVVWEQVNSTIKEYFLIIQVYKSFYFIKELKNGNINDINIDTFENSFSSYKTPRLITDEEKLQLL